MSKKVTEEKQARPSLLETAQAIKARTPRTLLTIDEEMIDLFTAYLQGAVTTRQVERALKIPQGSRIYSWGITVARHLMHEGRLKITKA